MTVSSHGAWQTRGKRKTQEDAFGTSQAENGHFIKREGTFSLMTVAIKYCRRSRVTQAIFSYLASLVSANELQEQYYVQFFTHKQSHFTVYIAFPQTATAEIRLQRQPSNVSTTTRNTKAKILQPTFVVIELTRASIFEK